MFQAELLLGLCLARPPDSPRQHPSNISLSGVTRSSADVRHSLHLNHDVSVAEILDGSVCNRLVMLCHDLLSDHCIGLPVL